MKFTFSHTACPPGTAYPVSATQCKVEAVVWPDVAVASTVVRDIHGKANEEKKKARAKLGPKAKVSQGSDSGSEEEEGEEEGAPAALPIPVQGRVGHASVVAAPQGGSIAAAQAPVVGAVAPVPSTSGGTATPAVAGGRAAVPAPAVPVLPGGEVAAVLALEGGEPVGAGTQVDAAEVAALRAQLAAAQEALALQAAQHPAGQRARGVPDAAA